jgi:hypothetical protein
MSKNRSAILVLGAIGLSLLVSIAVLLRGRSRPGGPKTVPEHAAPDASRTFPSKIGKSDDQPSNAILPESSQAIGWKEQVRQNLHRIAQALPDLKKAPVEQCLKGGWSAEPKLRINKEGDKIRSVDIYEPKDPRDRDYYLPPPGAKQTGMEMLSSIIIGEILKKKLPDDPVAAGQQLVDILKVSDTEFGSTAEASTVTTALRWQAAVALRGFPLEDNLRTEIEAMTLNHPDDVLRGALAGTLVAFKPTDDFVKKWIQSSPPERGLQAFLVELLRQDSRQEFPEDAEVSVTQHQGKFEISSKGGSNDVSIPTSGQQLGPDLVSLLTQPKVLQKMLEDSAASSTGDHYVHLRQNVPVVEDNRRKLKTAELEDSPGMILESLSMRMDPGLVQPLLTALETSATPRIKTSIVDLIGSQTGPEIEKALLGISGDKTCSNSERGSAIAGLLNQGTETGVKAVEGLLWDLEPRVRQYAGTSLISAGSAMSPDGLKRLGWLAENEPDPEARKALSSLYYRTRK